MKTLLVDYEVNGEDFCGFDFPELPLKIRDWIKNSTIGDDHLIVSDKYANILEAWLSNKFHPINNPIMIINKPYAYSKINRMRKERK
jgi:hypothetical protein